jgi:hypothetical protein
MGKWEMETTLRSGLGSSASGHAQAGATIGGKSRPLRIAHHCSPLHAGARSDRLRNFSSVAEDSIRFYRPQEFPEIDKDAAATVLAHAPKQIRFSEPKDEVSRGGDLGFAWVNTPRRRPAIISVSGAKIGPGTGNWRSSFCTLVRRRRVG